MDFRATTQYAVVIHGLVIRSLCFIIVGRIILGEGSEIDYYIYINRDL